MTPEKSLAKAEKENKDLYLQACLKRRMNFVPMVYPADRITGAEALSTKKRLAALLGYKLNGGYLGMCGFVKARMSLAIVRSNSLLLCGPRDKGVCILEQPELKNGLVMEIIAPWRG